MNTISGGEKMKLCPECKSDSIERTSSIALRVVGCVILLFIPYGLFFCWIPFVFPHSFRCHVCSYQGEEKQLLNIDWRDREALQEKYWLLEENLSPIMDKWFMNQEKDLFKVTNGSGQFLLLKIQGKDKQKEIDTYRILNYVHNDVTKKLRLRDISSKFHVLKEFPQQGNLELTDFGQGLFTEEEFELISKVAQEELLHHLEKEGKLIETINLDIEA